MDDPRQLQTFRDGIISEVRNMITNKFKSDANSHLQNGNVVPQINLDFLEELQNNDIRNQNSIIELQKAIDNLNDRLIKLEDVSNNKTLGLKDPIIDRIEPVEKAIAGMAPRLITLEQSYNSMLQDYTSLSKKVYQTPSQPSNDLNQQFSAHQLKDFENRIISMETTIKSIPRPYDDTVIKLQIEAIAIQFKEIQSNGISSQELSRSLSVLKDRISELEKGIVNTPIAGIGSPPSDISIINARIVSLETTTKSNIEKIGKNETMINALAQGGAAKSELDSLTAIVNELKASIKQTSLSSSDNNALINQKQSSNKDGTLNSNLNNSNPVTLGSIIGTGGFN